jgi:hypothetical protein
MGGVADEHARKRAEDCLDDPDDEEIATEHPIEQPEEVGIERCLIEDVVPDPVARGEALRPRVVAARVAHQRVEERRAAHLPHVQQPDGNSTCENYPR